MASRTHAVFVGTTTVSFQDTTSAALTWDLSSSPSGSIPTAILSESVDSKNSDVQSSNESVLSSSSKSSDSIARTTEPSQYLPQRVDKPKSTSLSSGLYVSLIVAGALLVVMVVVVGLLSWRRFRQQRRKTDGIGREDLQCGSTGFHTGSCPGIGQSSLKGTWRAGVLGKSYNNRCQPSNSEEDLHATKLSPSPAVAIRDVDPAEQRPTPPAKQRDLSSSPTYPSPRCSPRCRGAATHIHFPSPPLLELRDFSLMTQAPGKS